MRMNSSDALLLSKIKCCNFSNQVSPRESDTAGIPEGRWLAGRQAREEIFLPTSEPQLILA